MVEMETVKPYIQRRIRELSYKNPYLKNLKADKIIRMEGFETALIKTKWGIIVIQKRGIITSETWLTLSEILEILKLHEEAFKTYFEPLDIDYEVV